MPVPGTANGPGGPVAVFSLLVSVEACPPCAVCLSSSVSKRSSGARRMGVLPFAIIFLFQTMRMIPETSADKREWSVNIVLGSMSAASIKSIPTGFDHYPQRPFTEVDLVVMHCAFTRRGTDIILCLFVISPICLLLLFFLIQ